MIQTPRTAQPYCAPFFFTQRASIECPVPKKAAGVRVGDALTAINGFSAGENPTDATNTLKR